MRQEITKSQFRDAFAAMGRKEQFSYNALGALYDYLESLSENTGEEYSLDVIALCCEFCEATLDEVKQSYPNIESFEQLGEETIVIPVDEDTVIYQQY